MMLAVAPSVKGALLLTFNQEKTMLFHQLLAVVIYSGWHYGKIYHDNQEGHLDFQQSFVSVLLILLMSYLLFANTTLFFAITLSKLLYDIFMIVISPTPAILHIKNKQNLFDAMIGLVCCVVYTMG